MPAKQKSKDKIRAFHACQEEQAAARRSLNSKLMFWKACGHKKCLRAQACVVGDGKDCARRLWPVVPEYVKVGFRALVKAREARLSKDETRAEIVREITRWRETMARQAAPQAMPQATLESARPLLPIARAMPRAPEPRLRVL